MSLNAFQNAVCGLEGSRSFRNISSLERVTTDHRIIIAPNRSHINPKNNQISSKICHEIKQVTNVLYLRSAVFINIAFGYFSGVGLISGFFLTFIPGVLALGIWLGFWDFSHLGQFAGLNANDAIQAFCIITFIIGAVSFVFGGRDSPF